MKPIAPPRAVKPLITPKAIGDGTIRAYIRNMFADLLKRLVNTNPAPLADTDARLALTALLVRVARSDGDYDTIESQRIRAIITIA